jgi:NADPH-dependent curcumin reductase CurA
MEDIIDGLQNAPSAFQDIFEGRNRGKRLVKVAD